MVVAAGTGLRREHLKWLQALNLSYPVRNVKRDFSNGFLAAELFSKYFPKEIHMHSFVNGSSSTVKRSNWQLLEKTLRKVGFQMPSGDVDAMVGNDEEAAVRFIERAYHFLCKQDAAQAGSNQQQAQQRLARTAYGSARRQFGMQNAADDSQQEATYAQLHGVKDEDADAESYARIHAQDAMVDDPIPRFVFGRRGGGATPSTEEVPVQHESHANVYRWLSEHQSEADGSTAVWKKDVLLSNNDDVPDADVDDDPEPVLNWGEPEPEADVSPSALLNRIPYHSSSGGRGTSGTPRDMHARVTAPNDERASYLMRHGSLVVESAKGHSSHRRSGQTQNYWELGKLPPDLETEELREKKEAQKRAWGYAEQVKQLNQQQLQSKKSSTKQREQRPNEREPTKAERMMQFAKQIPKPEQRKDASAPNEKQAGGIGSRRKTVSRSYDELTELELQHMRDREQVQRIASEVKV